MLSTRKVRRPGSRQSLSSESILEGTAIKFTCNGYLVEQEPSKGVESFFYLHNLTARLMGETLSSKAEA